MRKMSPRLRQMAHQEFEIQEEKKWIPDDQQPILQSLLLVIATSKKPAMKELLVKGSTNLEITGFNREASAFRIKTTVTDPRIEPDDFNPETTTDFNPIDVSRPKGKISNRGKKLINHD